MKNIHKQRCPEEIKRNRLIFRVLCEWLGSRLMNVCLFVILELDVEIWFQLVILDHAKDACIGNCHAEVTFLV